ncbi:hypothetical protein Bbelb_098640 [Branchiostoma belcheri]|nr:hypothetical protein Bbelb_098640 [Branchiostoma belcheri]
MPAACLVRRHTTQLRMQTAAPQPGSNFRCHGNRHGSVTSSSARTTALLSQARDRRGILADRLRGAEGRAVLLSKQRFCDRRGDTGSRDGPGYHSTARLQIPRAAYARRDENAREDTRDAETKQMQGGTRGTQKPSRYKEDGPQLVYVQKDNKNNKWRSDVKKETDISKATATLVLIPPLSSPAAVPSCDLRHRRSRGAISDTKMAIPEIRGSAVQGGGLNSSLQPQRPLIHALGVY